MTPLEQLVAARELLSNKARWTQGWFAHDEGMHQVIPLAADAVCWCAYGALMKVDNTGRGDLFLDRAAEELSGFNVAYVNDRLGYEATMQMFARAVELAEAEG